MAVGLHPASIVDCQLNPPIPLDTPKGPAFAHVLTDYGRHHDVLDVCFVNDAEEGWGFPNRDARPQKNLTPGVRAPRRCGCAADAVTV
ncbi:MAG: hypothetical protein U0804_11520 [Gemmataceae bacterium]